MADKRDYYTCTELARLTGKVRNTIFYAIHRGEIEAHREKVVGQPKEIWAIPIKEGRRYIDKVNRE